MALKYHPGEDEERRARSPIAPMPPGSPPGLVLIVVAMVLAVGMTAYARRAGWSRPMQVLALGGPVVVLALVLKVRADMRRMSAEGALRRAPRCRLCGEVLDPRLNPRMSEPAADGRACPECGCASREA